MTGAVAGSCHCGAVQLTLAHAPGEVAECNCSLCTKTGFRGVYYTAGEVTVTGPLSGYVRADMDPACLTNWFCPSCGTNTHWTGLGDYADRVGVNAGTLDPTLVAGLPVKQVDGASW
jgi:hypothetical protein